MFIRKSSQQILTPNESDPTTTSHPRGILKAFSFDVGTDKNAFRRLRRRKKDAVKGGKPHQSTILDENPWTRFPVEIIGRLPPDGIPRPPTFIHRAPLKRSQKPLVDLTIPVYESDPFSAVPAQSYPENVRKSSQYLLGRPLLPEGDQLHTPWAKIFPAHQDSSGSDTSVHSEESADLSTRHEAFVEHTSLRGRSSIRSRASTGSLGSLICLFPIPEGYPTLHTQKSSPELHASSEHNSPPIDVPSEHLSTDSQCTVPPPSSSRYPSKDPIVDHSIRPSETSQEFSSEDDDDEGEEEDELSDVSTVSDIDISDLESTLSNDEKLSSGSGSGGSCRRGQEAEDYRMKAEAVHQSREIYHRQLAEIKAQFGDRRFAPTAVKKLQKGSVEAANLAQARGTYTSKCLCFYN